MAQNIDTTCFKIDNLHLPFFPMTSPGKSKQLCDNIAENASSIERYAQELRDSGVVSERATELEAVDKMLDVVRKRLFQIHLHSVRACAKSTGAGSEEGE